MPWIKRYVNEHHCKMPKINGDMDVKVGDIWECDHPSCKKRYIVRHEQRGGYYFDTYYTSSSYYDR